MSRNDPRTPVDLPSRIARLLALEFPAAKDIAVSETSKSWIFMTPQHVFKLKKKVRDDLQDLTSLRARHDNTLTEIDLNRRLARDTYLGAVRVSQDLDGNLCLGGEGETLDWLVKMQRLPEHRMLDVLIASHSAQPQGLASVMSVLAAELVDLYRYATVTNLTAGELITILRDQQEMNRDTLMNPRFAPYRSRFDAVFRAYDVQFDRFLFHFSQRVEHGWIRECHGDLRPEHICLTDPPAVFDCLEFNRNLRLVDPFSEIVFLGLECDLLGAPWVKPLLIDALTAGLCDRPDADLLRFYEIIHSLLRTRLCLAHLLVPAPRQPEKWLPLGLRYLTVAERLLF